MAIRGITLSADERAVLQAVVARLGAQAVCDDAQVRSPQSVYRALSGAPVLAMTAAALLASAGRLAAVEGSGTGVTSAAADAHRGTTAGVSMVNAPIEDLGTA